LSIPHTSYTFPEEIALFFAIIGHAANAISHIFATLTAFWQYTALKPQPLPINELPVPKFEH